MASNADKTKIWDGTDEQSVESGQNAAVAMLVPHHEVHEGRTFHASFLSTTADDDNVDLLIKVGSGKELHASFGASVQGDAELRLYEGVATSGIGTTLTLYDMNRSDSNSSGAATYYAPTVNTAGTELFVEWIPGGVRNAALGGTARSGTEWILAKSTDYLLRATNRRGSAATIVSSLQFYESD